MNFTETQILHFDMIECSNNMVKKLAEDWLELNTKIKQLENLNKDALTLLKFKNFPIQNPIEIKEEEKHNYKTNFVD